MKNAEVTTLARVLGKWSSHVPAANTDAVVTLAAASGTRHVVRGVHLSYSGAPTGGRLTITSDGNTLLDLDIVAGGPLSWEPQQPLAGVASASVVVTLAAGGGSVVGKLHVNYM